MHADVVDLNEVNRQIMLAVNGISQGNAFEIEIKEWNRMGKMEYRKMVLCAARHSHPAIDGLPAVFEDNIDPMDFSGLMRIAARKLKGVRTLDLYVTGLTPALVAVLNVCMIDLISCTLWHYNKDAGGYEPQVAATTYHNPEKKERL